MRIVLADDHVLVLDALQIYLQALQSEIEVFIATDFDQALAKASQLEGVDLIVLDFNMPGMNGLEGLSVMKQRFPDLPIVLLSGQATASLVREALSLGAAGFIPKDLAGKAMMKALELVLSGGTYIPSIALSYESSEPNGRSRGLYASDSPLSSLTPRELEVLSLLARGSTNKVIAQDLGLKEVTIAFHLKSVFRKLEVSSRTEAVATAFKLGLTL